MVQFDNVLSGDEQQINLSTDESNQHKVAWIFYLEASIHANTLSCVGRLARLRDFENIE